MTEKIVIKINRDDIHRFFPNANVEGILNNVDKPHIIIPTNDPTALLSELANCVMEWKATDVKITSTLKGYFTFEITWSDNYQIEIDV